MEIKKGDMLAFCGHAGHGHLFSPTDDSAGIEMSDTGKEEDEWAKAGPVLQARVCSECLLKCGGNTKNVDFVVFEVNDVNILGWWNK